MKQFAVSGLMPATSSAERAKQIFELFDEHEPAVQTAERHVINGATEVSLWKLAGQPSVKQVIDWKKHD